MSDTSSFESLGLSPAVLAAVKLKGFEEPTPIQALAIPRLLVPGGDLIARARTGTGKTAAFGIPLLETLAKSEGKGILALVLVPTRELAMQVAGEISSLRSAARPRIAAIYGGASYGEQFRRLSAGVEIVVGTPGRVLDHMERGSIDISGLEFLVLDEADEMLDMGFIEDIEKVMSKSPATKRTVLFSATMPEGVHRIAKRHLHNHEVVEDSSEAVATELAEQVWVEVREQDRIEALCRIIDAEEEFFGIVFTATKIEADRVARDLEGRGYESDVLHGDISQDRRERTLARFRDRLLRVLVATDVAARGIDIDRLTHVINWSLPHDSESYVHRVGRTGRAGNAGTAVTFVTPDEYRKLFRIRRVGGSSLKKGKVPAVSELIATRKERLRGRLLARAEKLGEVVIPENASATPPAPPPVDEHAPWLDFADELIARLPARDALAAALFEAFGSELDPRRYRDIVDTSVDAAATTRLFVGVGRRDGANPRSLAALVKRLSGLPDRLVGGIEVYENFSFLTVPFDAAEKVIRAAHSSGGLPPVRLATQRGGEATKGGGGFEKGEGAPRSGYGLSKGPRPHAGGSHYKGGPGSKGPSEAGPRKDKPDWKARGHQSDAEKPARPPRPRKPKP
ncbi:MAG TPA: DEAD/DEAH box helicase [Rectinemataceae bacterium]|nr:DEAD/DEAH box helicase [Rectinemataceae bacterium]